LAAALNALNNHRRHLVYLFVYADQRIKQTIAFWKSHLEAVPTTPWQPSPAIRRTEIQAGTIKNQEEGNK
jgi:hypothetical protein